MKKIGKKLAALLIAVLALTAVLTGCSGGGNEEDNVIRVGVSPTPHGEIMEVVKEVLAEEGYELEIVTFSDYVQPNENLESEDLDANYFQHQQYLDQFNEERGTHLVSVADVHYEPMGIFPGRCSSLEELPDGATIAVPNDVTNEARALILLQEQGLITLDENAGIEATIDDIVDNPKNLEIVEMEAAQITNILQDLDLAVINGNYALQAGLNAATDAIVTEDPDSDIIRNYYVNVLAVREGHENDEKTQVLVNALLSDTVRDYINENYSGSVVPVF